jgi:hypothetical protein
LPEEENAGEIAEAAIADFAGLVAAALNSIQSIGYNQRNDKGDDETRVERRSLIDWATMWAKPGPWAGVRSYKLWCCREGTRIRIAVRSELFS